MPPYADADPGAPLPTPTGHRFQGFRTEFGRAVAGTGGASFTSALGRYARTATGGTDVGPRRFGTAYTAGSTLADLVTDLQAGGTGQGATGVDLSEVDGLPIAEAIEAIAQTLAPDNPDADVIRIAVQEALAVALPDVDVFEARDITTDTIIVILVEFFTRIVFQDIVNDAGDAWNKAPDESRTIEAENELLDIVHAAVDNHLAPVLATNLQGLTRRQLAELQRQAIADVWAEWESYN